MGYDDYQILVEIDGRTGHEGVGRFPDMMRDNRFALIEWITTRYGWYDVVYRPCLVAFQLLPSSSHAVGTVFRLDVIGVSTQPTWTFADDRAR